MPSANPPEDSVPPLVIVGNDPEKLGVLIYTGPAPETDNFICTPPTMPWLKPLKMQPETNIIPPEVGIHCVLGTIDSL